MACKVLPCSCKNENQDAIHGKGMRLFNQLGDSDNYRCSGCGNTTKNNSPIKKK